MECVPPNVKKPKPVCKYGAKCYRKNPEHFENFDHPACKKVVSQQAQQKTAKSSPEQMFLFRHKPPTNIRLDPESPFVIGRGSDSTLRLPFGDVSRKHVIIKFNESEKNWVVKDCSTNGISINGKAVQSKTTVIAVQSDVLSMQVRTGKCII